MLRKNCASDILVFCDYVQSAYCGIWNFWIKNCKDLDLRCQSRCHSFIYSFFFFFFVTFFSVKLCALPETTLHKQADFPPSFN